MQQRRQLLIDNTANTRRITTPLRASSSTLTCQPVLTLTNNSGRWCTTSACRQAAATHRRQWNTGRRQQYRPKRPIRRSLTLPYFFQLPKREDGDRKGYCIMNRIFGNSAWYIYEFFLLQFSHCAKVSTNCLVLLSNMVSFACLCEWWLLINPYQNFQ